MDQNKSRPTVKNQHKTTVILIDSRISNDDAQPLLAVNHNSINNKPHIVSPSTQDTHRLLNFLTIYSNNLLLILFMYFRMASVCYHLNGSGFFFLHSVRILPVRYIDRFSCLMVKKTILSLHIKIPPSIQFTHNKPPTILFFTLMYSTRSNGIGLRGMSSFFTTTKKKANELNTCIDVWNWCT